MNIHGAVCWLGSFRMSLQTVERLGGGYCWLCYVQHTGQSVMKPHGPRFQSDMIELLCLLCMKRASRSGERFPGSYINLRSKNMTQNKDIRGGGRYLNESVRKEMTADGLLHLLYSVYGSVCVRS